MLTTKRHAKSMLSAAEILTLCLFANEVYALARACTTRQQFRALLAEYRALTELQRTELHPSPVADLVLFNEIDAAELRTRNLY